VTGIDPNENVLSIVDNYYPKVNVLLSKAQDIPMEDNEADLVFTRSVLQHIPPDEIKQVVREIKRISDSNADLLICEATTGLKKNAFYPRSVDDYSDLFETFDLENSWQRKSPAKSRKNTRTRMKFNNA
jgi:ubiquinone/menaquinone biosynthesis C-methylase UbiE